MSDNAQARLEESQPQEPASQLPLSAILPDFGQPRRLLPADLAEAIKRGELSVNAALQQWLERAEQDEAGAGLRRGVQELKRLADSIERHGLISPISVRRPKPDETVPPGIDYLIVTGERRYWAHLYLLREGRHIHEGETVSEPSHIKATVAAGGITIRAHQLIENLLREDINAIEKAQGTWALRYELSEVNYSSPAPAEAEADDEAEEDPLANLVPWRQVEEVLGISKRYRIFVISVLKLSEEAQALVAQHNLAEMTIRPIIQKLKDRPDLQLEALRQVVAWQQQNEADEGPGRAIVASVKELVEKLLAGAAGQAETAQTRLTRSVSSAPAIRFRNQIRQTLDFLNRLKPVDRDGLTKTLSQGDYADVMVDLRNLRQQIDHILDTVIEKRPPARKMTPPDEAEEE
jgi:ParB-like chromosome segregation protein Spo0J